jgi:hypothetical protein
MESDSTKKTIPLDYIRGLLVRQHGRCAITGVPLDPQEVNADHIVPLSRTELSPTAQEDNIWLVHKKVNAMKWTMTYDEFFVMCRMVIDHHVATEALLKDIRHRDIDPVSKEEFDHWVDEHCDETGKIKSEQQV